jgi:hypothetical protein
MQRTAKEKGTTSSKGSSGRKLFSKFTSPEQSYAVHCVKDKQHQKPQTPQTYGKRFRPPRSSIGHNRIFRKQVSQYGLPVYLRMT